MLVQQNFAEFAKSGEVGCFIRLRPLDRSESSMLVSARLNATTPVNSWN